MVRISACLALGSILLLAPAHSFARRRHPTTPAVPPATPPTPPATTDTAVGTTTPASTGPVAPPDPAVTTTTTTTTAPAISNAVTERLAASHMDAGNTYFQVSRYDEALREFQSAFDLGHSSMAQFNLARTHEALNHLPEAIAGYQAYIDSGARDMDPEVLRARIATLQARVNSAHVEPPHVEPSRPPLPSAAGPVAVIVGGGVVGLCAIIPGVLALGDIGAIQKAIDDKQWSTRADNAQASVQAEITAAYVLGVAGGAIMIGGFVYLGIHSSGARRAATTAWITPTPGGAMLSVGGTF